MSKKIQVTISNLRTKYDEKKIESYLKENHKDEYRNLFTQKDKRNNHTVIFSIKYDLPLLHKLKEFFDSTIWKLSHE